MNSEDFNKLLKAIKSGSKVNYVLSFQIQALENVLEKSHPQLYKEYQFELFNLLRENLHLVTDNPDEILQKFDSQSLH